MAHGSARQKSLHILGVTLTLSDWLPREKLKGCQSTIPTSYASGTLWPHGEWSLGYAKERGNVPEWHEDPYIGMGVLDTDAAKEGARAALPLDLSDVPKSCKWPRRGTKGMSGLGQQMIKAGGHLIQELWPHHRKTLGTITLPPMSQAARAEVVEKWPYLTRELLTWLSRRLQRQGLPPAILSVTEIQPKRLAESGEGSLHWHLLWLNQPGKKGNWAVDPCDVRAWLERVLVRHIPSYESGHINVDTRRVEGTVAAYLAKYMSKGKQMVQEAMHDWGYGLCPRTWWNMTKPMRDLVKAETHQGRHVGAALESILHWWLDNPTEECYAFIKPIVRDLDGWEVIIGWRGRFEPHLRQDLTSMLKSFDIEGFTEV